MIIMDKTMELMKKNVVMLDENSDVMETVLEDMDMLLKRGYENHVDKPKMRCLINKLKSINDVIIHLIGDDLVHILENDTEYHNSKTKIGLNKDIEEMCGDYKEWIRDADLSKLKEVENKTEPPVIGLSPEVCFKLGELIGTISRLSISLKNMDSSTKVKDIIVLELAVLEKTAMNIAQELFHPKK